MKLWPHSRPSFQFFSSVAILLIVLLACNLVIARTARKTQRQRLLTAIGAIPQATDYLFLGNSLVEAGCDPATFAAAWPNATNRPHPVNLALGGTSPVEHCLVLNYALQRPLAPKRIIYGFFDDQLNSPVSGELSALVGNRALSYRFPTQAAALYAPGSWFKTWELRVIGHIPMLAERSSLWAKVELLRRRLEEIGLPARKTNRFGRVEDFTALEAGDIASFNQRCQAVLRERKGFSLPIRELINLAHQRRAQLIFVEMPMPSRHRQIFYSSPGWTELRTYLRALAEQNHLIYLSASDWIQNDDYFEDATHLSQDGAKCFSAKLAQAISGLESGKFPFEGSLHGRNLSQRE